MTYSFTKRDVQFFGGEEYPKRDIETWNNNHVSNIVFVKNTKICANIFEIMYLILDERETQLYDLCKTLIPADSSILLLKRVLSLGDASIQLDATSKELVLFERKSIRDLLASIKDGRYEEQSHRLTHASQLPAHNIVYLIEGMYSQTRTAQEKQTVLSAITSLNLFKGFSVLRTCSLNETAEMMVSMCNKIDRDLKRGKTLFHTSDENSTVKESLENHGIPDISGCEAGIPKESAILKYCEVVKKVKKDNITPQNIGEIILSQIPGISSVTAIAIMRNFTSFSDFMDKIREDPAALMNVRTTDASGKTRKISSAVLKNIQIFLLNSGGGGEVAIPDFKDSENTI